MTRWFLIAILCACGSKNTAVPAAGSGSAPGSGSAGSAVAAAAAVVADAASAGLSPKIKAARCGEPCLFLVDTPFDKLLDAYKSECAGMETKDPGFSDCKKLDFMRMCIYAAHGAVDNKGKYKKRFGDKAWYEPHPEYDVHSLVGLERDNVHELYERGKACKKGMHVSGADYDRIKAWFAALPNVPPGTPKLLFNEETEIAPAEFVAKLVQDYFSDAKPPFKIGSTFGAEYIETNGFMAEPFAKAVEALKAKTRMIFVTTSSSSTAVYFVYDDKNQLVAAASQFIPDGE
jgi:hypothetical protein